MRVLVTGGAGFIGSRTAKQLLARGHEVAIIDDLSSSKRENIPEYARFYETDIRTGCAEVFENFRPEVLSHQAAQMDVRRSVRERPRPYPCSTKWSGWPSGNCSCSCSWAPSWTPLA